MSDISTVFVGTCDLAGHVRGRSTPAQHYDDLLASGTGWVPANLAMTSFGQIAAGSPFGSVGDLRLIPDPSSLIEVPEDGEIPGLRLMLADMLLPDGSPWDCCPRKFLKDAVSDLHALGFHLLGAFEHEFMLRDFLSSHPFSLQRLRAAEPFGSDLVRLLSSCGLEPETWLPEYGDGQFEITVRPTAALAAADRAVLLRELVRDLARRRGHRMTFAPLLDPEGTGNGVHVHFSLRAEDGTSALYDPERPGRLSDVGGAFAAGVLRHAAALSALTVASPVSFLRLMPHRWSSGGVFLAEHDREALLRICPITAIGHSDPGLQFNLEYRASDATANPWLVLGAIIRAGLEGIRRGYPPPRVWLSGQAASEIDVPALPTSMNLALDALEADAVACSWFSHDLLATYLTVKRAEIAVLDGLNDHERCLRVADVY